MKIIIDTNVVIDALSDRMPFAPESQKVLLLAEQKQIEGYITSNTVTDIYYLLHKYLHDASKTKSVMSTLFQSLRILAVNEQNCKNSLTSFITDYEDAIIDEVACEYSIDYIVTRNIKDFNNSKIKAITPEKLISFL